MKKCVTCIQEKPENVFVVRNGKTQGQCKECRSAYVKQYKLDRALGVREKNTVIVTNDGKVCKVCNVWKPLVDYPKRNSEHGYRHECKDCKRSTLRQYYADVYNKVRRDKKRNVIEYKILCNHRHYIYKCLTRYSLKTQSSVKYIGCDVAQLKEWLEYQFNDQMNWDNYGTKWSIDHIIPLSLFDLQDTNEQKIAFHWTNLQPSTDNFVKGNKFRSWEYFNALISAHRFLQKHRVTNGYQSLRESLDWLRRNSDKVTIP